MPLNDYHFVTIWRLEGTAGEVADVLRDPLSLSHWWPSVYLAVRELSPPDSNGLGQRVQVHTKGFLPYSLRWEFVVTESRYPSRFALDASGDFVGRGVWTIEQDGAEVHATYDWRIRAERPLLQALAPLLRPLLEANHRWAMRQGEESLKLELGRRRAASGEARRSIQPPPGPVTYTGVALLAGAAILAGGLACAAVRVFRRRRPDADRSEA
jgi:hypothetical protein